MEVVRHRRRKISFGGLVSFWHRDMLSVESDRRLRDLRLAMVYILLPKSAHAHCARWLNIPSLNKAKE